MLQFIPFNFVNLASILFKSIVDNNTIVYIFTNINSNNIFICCMIAISKMLNPESDRETKTKQKKR